MSKELEYAMSRERAWSKAIRGMDTGSYCENAASDAVACQKIIGLYRQLTDVLLAYERSGYKQPEAQP